MIADFGLSEHENVELEALTSLGMPAYIDPQCFENPFYISRKSDIYSFGVILWEISSCQQPFLGKDVYYIACNVHKGMREKPVEDTPKKYNQLYVDCWNYEPDKRPEASSVLETLQALVEQYDPMIETVNINDINNQNLDYFEIKSDITNQSPVIQVSINVVNPSIKSYKFKLSKEEKLDRVRNMILNEEKSNNIQFDYFVSKKNEPILHEEESNISLGSILRPSISNCFYIQIVDVWEKLIKMIEQGFIFKDDLIENAAKSAFKINKDKIKSEIFKINENSNLSERFNYEEEKQVCECKFDILCSRNLVSCKGSIILPWLSIFLGKSKESSKQTLKNQTTTDIFITKFKRAEIFISKEYVILTEEFKKKIENTLDSLKSYYEIIDDLREITKNYGCFYARHIVFGGAIIKEENAKYLTNSYLSFIGGGNLGDKPSLTTFMESLEDFKKWKIIEYSDIYPIFDLLDDALRKKVLDVLGYRILKADIKEIPFGHFSKKISYIYSLSPQLGELSKITNIKDCHIFASIMNQEDGVFSVRVEYIDENIPVIVVHNITYKSIRYEHPIKIGWIIVGQPNNFDFDFTQAKYPIVLKSKKYSVTSKVGKHYKVEIPKHSSCILSTCVLETTSITTKETLVVGAHIIPFSHSACIFVHDLKDEFVNDDGLLQKLKLFVCTIDADQECNAGQININWIKSKTQPLVFHGTGKEDSSIFPGNKNFNQDETLCNEELILVNQLFENCRNHGFLNVNSKEIIFKALNTPSLDSERIGYFLAP
ncbi:kinase-like protein [Gigaspora margarita]|nr:kinase-like protein [Gigaspora margarita]